MLGAKADVTALVGDEGGAEEFWPVGLMLPEGQVGEEGFSVCEAALGAGGLVPVTDREGILGLGSGLRVAGEEARE